MVCIDCKSINRLPQIKERAREKLHKNFGGVNAIAPRNINVCEGNFWLVITFEENGMKDRGKVI